MPEMTITRAGRAGKPSLHANEAIPNAFSGNNVYVDPVLGAEGMSVANVTFTPCGRTYWHTHEKGQLVKVLAGAGWICDRGGKPTRISVGDVIWCPPGTTHWHGADDDSYLCHQVASFGGVEWLEEVKDEEYAAKGGS